MDVNSVLYSHMYHGKKHKFVTQDIQNNQLIKAKSGRYFSAFKTATSMLVMDVCERFCTLKSRQHLRTVTVIMLPRYCCHQHHCCLQNGRHN